MLAGLFLTVSMGRLRLYLTVRFSAQYAHHKTVSCQERQDNLPDSAEVRFRALAASKPVERKLP